MTDSESLYISVIQRTIETLLKTPESSSIRRDIIDTIKRRWMGALVNSDESAKQRARNVSDSDPSTVDRTKYMVRKANSAVRSSGVAAPEPVIPTPDSDDEFADEFGDSEFIHATQVGKKLAEGARSQSEPKKVAPRPVSEVPEKKAALIVDAEELDDSLAYTEYDDIPEPMDCSVRVFGQTEICESNIGPKRSESRWMVTVLNGFVRLVDSGEEIPFRTANQTIVVDSGDNVGKNSE